MLKDWFPVHRNYVVIITRYAFLRPARTLTLPCFRLEWGVSCLYSPEALWPRGVLLGNRASGVRNSRKLKLYRYSFSETLYVGVVLDAADRGCVHEFPPNRVLGNSGVLYKEFPFNALSDLVPY